MENQRSKIKDQQNRSARLRSLLQTANGKRLTGPTAGFALIAIVILAGVFLLIGTGLASYLLTMQRAEVYRVSDEQAFQIAEAGVEYYAWHLAHFPNDVQDGTGHNGPYVHTYTDTSGTTVGTFTLTITPNYQCGVLQSVDISSVGASIADPLRTKTVAVRYAQQTVVNYSSILASSPAWFGPGSTVYGRVHSKNGIRMDGTNMSTVESEVGTWDCTSTYGCSPEQTTAQGVLGNGSNSALWKWGSATAPVSVAPNLSTMKSAVQTGGGIYLAPTGIQNGGYHLTFNSNGTVTVNEVTAVNSSFYSYSVSAGAFIPDTTLIQTQSAIGVDAISSSCSVVYADDNVWVDGVVNGKITVGTPSNAYLPNNITYTAYDGTDGLAVVASQNVIVTLDSPNNMLLNGAFTAISGVFGRNAYYSASSGYGAPYIVPSQYDGSSGALRSSLSLSGMWLSKKAPVLNWSSIPSGYPTRNYLYDGTFASRVPPFTPTTTSQYSFISWKQQ